MARMTGSWLSGPHAALPRDSDGTGEGYRGERLGLPESGPGALASVGRRVGAITVDWAIATLFAWLITRDASWNYAVWVAISIITVALFSVTPGQVALGIGVARVDKAAPVGLWRAVVRVALVGLVFPAAIWDADSRGLQDRLTDTALIRSR
ncbi:MAG: RDD family protein [Actinomycetota bacterium]|nr:RDD family protein [Actinomycetota bacterium]